MNFPKAHCDMGHFRLEEKIMDLLEGIYTRRSVRQYTAQPVEREQLLEIIRAGTWAPSGLNNQPWRFVIVREREVRLKLAEFTKYRAIIESAPACIAVFVDRGAMYNDVKDHQAMGACLQNMLLAAHALGLGAVWLGEILNNSEKVRLFLELPPEMELMAVIAVGHPRAGNRTSQRKKIEAVLLREL
jgi:nitroreductase